MKATKKISLIIIFSGLISLSINAQNQELSSTLKDLTKATKEELTTKEITLDGVSIPIYSIEGKRMVGNEIASALMSGEFAPDFYFDKNKEIKIIVFRKATEEENKKLKNMEKQMVDSENYLIDEYKLDSQAAIPFNATDIYGLKYSLENLKGKIIVMNFWFVACKPCITEMPELNKLVDSYKNQDVVFLGFALDPKPKIDSFLKKMSFSYAIIPNSKKIVDNYKVSSFPTNIIINQNSKIVYSASGLTPSTIDEMAETIENLIK